MEFGLRSTGKPVEELPNLRATAPRFYSTIKSTWSIRFALYPAMPRLARFDTRGVFTTSLFAVLNAARYFAMRNA